MNNLEMDALIDEVLRAEPLAPAPSGIHRSVMAAVQRNARPLPGATLGWEIPGSFRLTWLDAALSLFGALMFGVVWLVWGLLQSSEAAPWLEYLGLLLRWNLERALYTDRGLLLSLALGFGAMVFVIGLVWTGCSVLGICTQRNVRV